MTDTVIFVYKFLDKRVKKSKNILKKYFFSAVMPYAFWVFKNLILSLKICCLREKLNESIINGEDYSIIYQLSIELDELIAQYYRNDVIKR